MMGINLCIVRHFVGGNALITSAGVLISFINKSIGHYTPLIINLVQLVAAIVAVLYISPNFGRRPLFLFSLGMLSILNFAIVIAMSNEHILSIMFIICIYMIIYGGTFMPPSWSYPSEVIPAQ
jgi:hypothetical protein